ncbi:hypothetical protein PHK61_22605 [Actinomycetospora lutea]|uniref:hypothetical protein n=1 Tax=Actinomycetospora lutea TaxID=663604 RepID=UPI0023669E1F|nr:hypothetical protein [Actinomycetospora lutea]MDD7941214.1 hypothetical protein [Actinomycetospora lutea]
MTEAPDAAIPVVGFRLWLLGGARTAPDLRSPAVAATWAPRTAMVAACPRGCARPPGWDCGCGLYATSVLDRLLVPAVGDGVLLGCVALWGRVVEADQGWRAEYAYPLALLVPRRRPLDRALEQYLSPGLARMRRARWLARGGRAEPPDEGTLAALGERYGVPVHVVAGLLPRIPDDDLAHRAAALRDEAARGLPHRRLGDGHARHRFTRAIEELVAAFEGWSDPEPPPLSA